MAERMRSHLCRHSELQPLVAQRIDGFAMSVIEHVGRSSLLLAFYDLDGRATKRANADTCLGIAQRCDGALQITFLPSEGFWLRCFSIQLQLSAGKYPRQCLR